MELVDKHTNILPVIFREKQTVFCRNTGLVNYEVGVVRAFQGIYQTIEIVC